MILKIYFNFFKKKHVYFVFGKIFEFSFRHHQFIVKIYYDVKHSTKLFLWQPLHFLARISFCVKNLFCFKKFWFKNSILRQGLIFVPKTHFVPKNFFWQSLCHKSSNYVLGFTFVSKTQFVQKKWIFASKTQFFVKNLFPKS